MATYKADTHYSYKKGGVSGTERGTNVNTLFVVNGRSEPAVIEAIKKKHGQQSEVIINNIIWK